MATVNIGNLTFTHRGDYAGGTAYAKNDVVYYATNGNAYIAKQATTGNVPTNGTYWSQFAQGSGGIWNAGLSLGSAGQVVKVNSAGNALEFGADAGGKIGQVICVQKTNTTSYGGQSWADISGMTATITPSSTSSKILWAFHGSGNSHTNYAHIKIVYGDGSNLTTQAIGDTRGSRTRSTIAAIYDGGNDVGAHWSAQGLDSPNTTSATTYKLQWYVRSGNVQLNYRNYDADNIGQETAMSSITLMEIL